MFKDQAHCPFPNLRGIIHPLKKWSLRQIQDGSLSGLLTLVIASSFYIVILANARMTITWIHKVCVCRVVLTIHGDYKREDHLNSNRRRYGRMCLIIDQFEVLVTEIKNIVHVGIDFHLRRRQGLSG